MNPPPSLSPRLLEQLEAYYDYSLPATEATQLRAELAQDPALARAVAEWEAVYRHGLRQPAPIAAADTDALRRQFAALEAELPPLTAEAAPRRRLPRWSWAAAAALLLLLGLSYWLLLDPSPTEQIVANEFAWLPRQEATLGPTEDIPDGLRAYDRQDYATAYPLLLQGVEAGQLDSINLLYTGVAALGAEAPTVARDALQALLDAGTYTQSEPEIRYYLALAHLQLGDRGAGTQVLQPLTESDGPWSDRARRLLADIEQLD
ncbi:hypothetical protein LEM8419_03188 [Neolewinella maritima]|uniref:Tetratricopeptide repeat protein n=1 Tax=Neolewinella maritima TaxID=1383882 RepID=A0ABM9B526_9BACT|nr:hypothetical protein [Neolewinella maritima]CAH1002269.1 hypothetical protein LEM8419_03188 [Neolewinella maritima]